MVRGGLGGLDPLLEEGLRFDFVLFQDGGKLAFLSVDSHEAEKVEFGNCESVGSMFSIAFTGSVS